MDDAQYSASFKSLLFHLSRTRSDPKRLSETLLECYRIISDQGRGLRVLEIGPGHGHLIEDALAEAEVKIERFDCVEQNSYMAAELESRIKGLAEKYGFDYKIYNKWFSIENVSFFLQKFYDLLVLSNVLYSRYFDNPAQVLKTALYQLTNDDGRAIVCLDLSENFPTIRNDLYSILPRDDETTAIAEQFKKPFDINRFLIEAETRTIAQWTDVHGLALHLALKPARPCISEEDNNIRRIGDEILSFITRRNVGAMSDEKRAVIQDVVKKYAVDSYGFPILPITSGFFVLARK